MEDSVKLFCNTVLVFVVGLIISGYHCQILQTNSVHRTPAAERPANDLWCYRCEATDEYDQCVNLKGNSSQLIHKCKDEKRICMVKRYSYTTSTENSTSLLKMWSLERNCTARCEPGCIIIGERTKLYACTSCCDKSLCNMGSTASKKGLNANAFVNTVILFTIFFISSCRIDSNAFTTSIIACAIFKYLPFS